MHRVKVYKSFRRLCTRTKSAFDLDAVTKDFAKITEWAAANYANSGKTFRMVLPPPNVTGKLHLGHAMTVTIEDTLCRHHRIKGGVAHWIPGFDHAGIATQSVVERELWKEKGLRRDQLNREDFMKLCIQWSEKNSLAMRNQLDMLGATLDWKNSYYTLDEKFSAAVTKAFVTLYNEGLIYRDKKVVNWCPYLRSSLSDQEVDRLEVLSSSKISVPSPEGGKRDVEVGTMYRIRYPLDGGDSSLEVGTTRPETVYADVALAVNPADERYSRFVGKLVCHPLLPHRKLPIVADSSVQIDKGTGVLKITPSHDSLDYEIASRHWEEILAVDSTAHARSCIEENGRLSPEASEFAGLDRFNARVKIIEKLSSLGLYVGTMKHAGQISICSRTGDIVEPRLAEQWFMNTADLYEKAEQAVREGKIRITPKSQEQKLFDWFANRDPWCLSRQLVWGHRIPAYKAVSSSWFIANSLDDARKHFGDNAVITQDQDVLDTWFSSSLIPLVAAGWPNPDFNPSAPLLDVMETGWDILGFWVARMIIMTMSLSGGQVPFSHVLLHGLIRDSSGRKMSKSFGNVIDPLDVIVGISQEKMIERIRESALSQEEIATATSDISSRYPQGIPRSGTDALRFALLRHDLLASDVPLNIADFADEGLRFCNKLWNMVAYLERVAENSPTLKDVDSDNAADEWILSRLAGTLLQVDNHMSDRAPHLAFAVLHNFILSSLCDVYLETTKRALWNGDLRRISEIRTILVRVAQPTLVQLSVFMPFVAQHLYEKAFGREPGSIYFDFVKPSFFQIYRNEELESDMDMVLRIVKVIRSLRSQLQLPSSMAFTGVLQSEDLSANFTSLLPTLSDLSNLEIREVVPAGHTPEGFLACPVPGSNARIFLKIQDSNRAEFVSRLERLLKKSKERSEQFFGKAEKYEAIVAKERNGGKVKPHVIEKNERKARQARNVATSAEEEAKRLQQLLEEMRS
ncbi:unnamed protein product [Cylicocyclus nassatus]|uniref:valine--tRNA ligase n=1 Tax=Cylicocyclus nassatus TaxID=53992 RepID=A0AA36DLP0_CYLNA|nr:unnamed protein product [Cylicocyclus nassatus]